MKDFSRTSFDEHFSLKDAFEHEQPVPVNSHAAISGSSALMIFQLNTVPQRLESSQLVRLGVANLRGFNCKAVGEILNSIWHNAFSHLILHMNCTSKMSTTSTTSTISKIPIKNMYFMYIFIGVCGSGLIFKWIIFES